MKLKLSVGEPFDFQGPSGPNRLYAESYAQGNGEFGEYLLCTCEPFARGGIVVLGLMLNARHKNRNVIREVLGRLTVPVNAGFKLDGGLWTQEDVERADKSFWGGFLIGSAKKMDEC